MYNAVTTIKKTVDNVKNVGTTVLTATGREVPLSLEREESESKGDTGGDPHSDQNCVHLAAKNRKIND
jgi:hypothetical protein